MALRDAWKDPVLEYLLQLIPTSFQFRCVREHTVEPWYLAVVRSIVRENLVARLSHGCLDVLTQHVSIIVSV